MGPVGRVPSNFGNHGDLVYLVPSNFCDWLSFWPVSTLYNRRQMYIVDRMTTFTLQKTMSGEVAPGQRGANCADPLIGLERESVWKKWVKLGYTANNVRRGGRN